MVGCKQLKLIRENGKRSKTKKIWITNKWLLGINIRNSKVKKNNAWK